MIIHGDALNMPLQDCSVDAIVTDPPYGLEFMNKDWDRLWGKDQSFNNNRKSGCWQFGNTPSSKNRPRYKAGLEAQLWHTQWLTEAYRVLKPGGSMLVMGGTRTFHRLMCAIEDAGFIIKDTLMWIYGSGFPKAQDLGKMIDKRIGAKREKELIATKRGNLPEQAGDIALGATGFTDVSKPQPGLAKHWDGFKVGGIKPAYEPIVWAVKLPEGSYVDNVLKWGVGAVNVDECRIGLNNNEPNIRPNQAITERHKFNGATYRPANERMPFLGIKGRFPANIILGHHPECVQVGMKRMKPHNGSGIAKKGNLDGHTYNKHGDWGLKAVPSEDKTYLNPDGLETVESWRCHPDCPVKMMDEQSGVLRGSHGTTGTGKGHSSGNIYPKNLGGKVGANYPDTNSSGASRFFYCAKASRSERNAGLDDLMIKGKRQQGRPKRDDCGRYELRQDGSLDGKKTMPAQNNHPTVKPIALFEWLIKLVTREGQAVLDPFLGSGTTAISAHNTGRKCIGIEKEGEYIEIAKRRVEYHESQPRQMEMRV